MTRVRYRRISEGCDNRKVADSAIDIAISSNQYDMNPITMLHMQVAKVKNQLYYADDCVN